MVQIPLDKDAKKLTILIEENDTPFKKKFEFDLIINSYFYLDKIIYPDSYEKEITLIEILSKYFD